MELKQAAQMMREGIANTFAYRAFPREHWQKIRTIKPLVGIIREIRGRT